MLKFWLAGVETKEPWTSGGKATVRMTNDAVPGFEPHDVPCPEITTGEMVAKMAAMPGALLSEIAAAIVTDKLGVPVAVSKPAAATPVLG